MESEIITVIMWDLFRDRREQVAVDISEAKHRRDPCWVTSAMVAAVEHGKHARGKHIRQ